MSGLESYAAKAERTDVPSFDFAPQHISGDKVDNEILRKNTANLSSSMADKGVLPKLNLGDASASGASQMMAAQSENDGEVKTANESKPISDKVESPRGAKYDNDGNLTSYKIGPEGKESEVSVTYADPKAKPPIIKSLSVDRQFEGTTVHDKDLGIRQTENKNESPYTYKVEGLDAQVVDNVRIDPDGRIHVYLGKDDRGADREVVSINPQTGRLEPNLKL